LIRKGFPNKEMTMSSRDHPGFSTRIRFLGCVLGTMACMLGLLSAGCSRDEPRPRVCPDPLGCIWIGPEQPIRIVSLQTISGDLQTVGLEYARSLELAVADRGNTLLGHPIKILYEDDKCSREGGLTATHKIIADETIAAIHGPTCSSAAVPAADLMSEAGLVMISGSATAPSLTSVSERRGEHWRPGFFRTAPNDKSQGLAAASFAYMDLDLRRAATIHDGSPYSLGLVQSFESSFQDFGGRVVFSGAVDPGDQNMAPLLTAIERSGADLIFFPIFPPEGERIVREAATRESFSDIALISADGLFAEIFVDAVDTAGQGMYFIAPLLPMTETYQTFGKRFEAVHGLAPNNTFHAHAYDAGALLLTALEKASAVEEDGVLRIGRQAVRDALHAVRDFPALTGNLSCDAFGDCGVPRFKLVRLDDPRSGFEALAENVVAAYDAQKKADTPADGP
jgi:branched-chain amino acid transport system substrate-binding protein